MSTDRPAIYCGTYAKYNSGSVVGEWIALEDHADAGAFLAACRALHSDEPDPELMFQDFRCFPNAMYSESPDKALLERLYTWLALDDGDRELLALYHEHVNEDGDIEEAREAFAGKFDTKEEWAEQFLEDTGSLDEIPEDLRRYFDFESYARDCELGGDMTFARHGGGLWAFHNH